VEVEGYCINNLQQPEGCSNGRDKGLLKLPMLILFASCTPVIGLPFQQSIMGGQSQVGVSNGVEAVCLIDLLIFCLKVMELEMSTEQSNKFFGAVEESVPRCVL